MSVMVSQLRAQRWIERKVRLTAFGSGEAELERMSETRCSLATLSGTGVSKMTSDCKIMSAICAR